MYETPNFTKRSQMARQTLVFTKKLKILSLHQARGSAHKQKLRSESNDSGSEFQRVIFLTFLH